MPNVLLIPAYRPGPELIQVVEAAGGAFERVVVVDDGSGPAHAAIFEQCRDRRRATVLQHPRNLGKGAALRTGIGHIVSMRPECGVVTADADGQHHPEDILRVSARLEREPESLVLGSRGFDEEVPGRSRAGNWMARAAFRLLIGQKLRDTQTGLRGIPRRLLPRLLTMRASGYEFEIGMLAAARHLSIPIVEEPVRTIYEPGNPSSHFSPLKDSVRIGFVLARFLLLALATAAFDIVVFWVSLGAGAAAAQAIARSAAVLVSYPLARRAVFLSGEPHGSMLARDLTLASSGAVSFGLLNLIESRFHTGVLEAKIAAEAALFLVNFVAQRGWVFVVRAPSADSKPAPEPAALRRNP